MNTLPNHQKISKGNLLYFSIIVLTLLNIGCSVEANHSNNQVSEQLMSQTWLRDRYLDQDPNGTFEAFATRSELEFFSNGNLLIIESKSTDSIGAGALAPPQGLVDTLLIYGKWTYYDQTKTLTLQVDDSISRGSMSSYIQWTLSAIDDHHFMIENTQIDDASDILKVRFKGKKN